MYCKKYMMTNYVYTYDQVKSLLQSKFGKTLTEEQFNYIREINEDVTTSEEFWSALNILLDWDLELICRTNG